MCDVDTDNQDQFGFNKVNITCSKEGGGEKVPVLKIIFRVFLIIILVSYIGISGFSSYYAWVEFPQDDVVNKIVKAIIAALFSPVYLIYTFLKISILKGK